MFGIAQCIGDGSYVQIFMLTKLFSLIVADSGAYGAGAGEPLGSP